jgi:hypothetical protein
MQRHKTSATFWDTDIKEHNIWFLSQQRHNKYPPAYNASVCYLELRDKQRQNHKVVYYTLPLLLKYTHCNEYRQQYFKVLMSEDL